MTRVLKIMCGVEVDAAVFSTPTDANEPPHDHNRCETCLAGKYCTAGYRKTTTTATASAAAAPAPARVVRAAPVRAAATARSYSPPPPHTASYDYYSDDDYYGDYD